MNFNWARLVAALGCTAVGIASSFFAAAFFAQSTDNSRALLLAYPPEPVVFVSGSNGSLQAQERLQAEDQLQTADAETRLGSVDEPKAAALTAAPDELVSTAALATARTRSLSISSEPRLASVESVPDRSPLAPVVIRSKTVVQPDTLNRVVASLEMDEVMTLDEQSEVALLIQIASSDPSVPSSMAEMQATFASPTRLFETIEATPQIMATLVGADFEIDQVKGGWQAVVSKSTAVWTWMVRPKAEGKRKLLLVLENALNVSNTVVPMPVKNFPREITVMVHGWQWLTDISTWSASFVGGSLLSLATLVSGAVGVTQLQAYFEARKKKRQPTRRRSTKPPPSPA